MASLWFWIVTAMIATYAVLDGLDLGAGAIYLIAAKTNDERRRVLRAIGPVWDGNELWLLAVGAALCFVFPRLYASCLRGFYLPLVIVFWLVVLRVISIGLRPAADGRSQRLADAMINVSSILLVLCFGVVLGNVVRGVPLDSSGHFFEPLWINFKLGPQTGLLDWYTSLVGVLALVSLAAHGAYYIALKTDEDLGRRGRGFALLCWPVQFFLTISTLLATYFIRPEIVANYEKHPVGILVPTVIVASLATMLVANPKGKEKLAFAASSLYIAAMLGGAAFAFYPVVLAARDEQYDLTIHNASVWRSGSSIGPVWWIVGAVIVVAYFAFALRKFRGKVKN
jgi:cytochrome bd ubiquinol oxidase subunit II